MGNRIDSFRGTFAEFRHRRVFRVVMVYLVVGWLLIQVASTTFGPLGLPDWALTLVIVLVGLGFLIAWALAWAYDVADRDPAGPSPVTAAASVPAMAAAPPATREASVAILPLVDFSATKDQAYFCDGLSEDLITALSQFAGLTVISRDSSFQFRDRTETSASIGQKLGVAHLLEGSVRRAGDAIRVSVTLVKAADGSTLWSQHYDRAYQDLFALQDDVTHAVATALQAKLLASTVPALQNTRPPSGSLEAYNAWLQGNFYAAPSTEDGLRRAISEYGHAIELDPSYAQALADRSLASTTLGARYLSGQPLADAYERGRDDVNRALSLAPELPDAHVALGRSLEIADFNLVGAEAAYRKAVAQAPDAAGPKLHLGRTLAALGRPEQGVEQLRQALQLDPLNSPIYRALADIQLVMGELDAAEHSIRKAIALRPDAASNHRTLVYIHVRRGDAVAALRDAEQEPGVVYRDVETMMARQIGGDAAKADGALADLIAKYGDYAAFQVAGAYALRKEPDQAFAWLDRAWAARDGGIPMLWTDPFLRDYRDDARFAAFCRKVGFPAPDCMDH